jgi:hypothetical protein
MLMGFLADEFAALSTVFNEVCDERAQQPSGKVAEPQEALFDAARGSLAPCVPVAAL